MAQLNLPGSKSEQESSTGQKPAASTRKRKPEPGANEKTNTGAEMSRNVFKEDILPLVVGLVLGCTFLYMLADFVDGHSRKVFWQEMERIVNHRQQSQSSPILQQGSQERLAHSSNAIRASSEKQF